MTLAVVGCLGAGMGGCADSPADAALGFVRRLGGRAETVRRIDLAHTATTDADLARLAKLGGEALAGVEDLDLTHTAITDSGLTTLAAFPTLRKLSLTLTAVTDAGVEPLSRLSSLRRLVLLRTAVSAAGLERLRRALPGATIDVEPPVVRARRAAR